MLIDREEEDRENNRDREIAWETQRHATFVRFWERKESNRAYDWITHKNNGKWEEKKMNAAMKMIRFRWVFRRLPASRQPRSFELVVVRVAVVVVVVIDSD